MAATLHVLVVEDDPVTAFNIEHALRRSPEVATLTHASDGRDALDRLRRGRLVGARVVVLTDLSMPRMSGFELAAAIRADPRLRGLPILVLTTSTAEADRAAARALGVDAYIVKSDTSAPLAEVRAWLGNYAAGLAAA
ncbi:MAG: response regulator [Myxococcales bacterium]|nr:response regulator [Myxococcales bacterium]